MPQAGRCLKPETGASQDHHGCNIIVTRRNPTQVPGQEKEKSQVSSSHRNDRLLNTQVPCQTQTFLGMSVRFGLEAFVFYTCSSKLREVCNTSYLEISQCLNFIWQNHATTNTAQILRPRTCSSIEFECCGCCGY